MTKLLTYIFLLFFSFTSSVNAGYSNAVNRGETGVPPNSTGKLPRPQYQVNKLNKNSTNHFDYKVKGEYNGKAEVRRIETETIDKFKLKDPRSLPGNKGRH